MRCKKAWQDVGYLLFFCPLRNYWQTKPGSILIGIKSVFTVDSSHLQPVLSCLQMTDSWLSPGPGRPHHSVRWNETQTLGRSRFCYKLAVNVFYIQTNLQLITTVRGVFLCQKVACKWFILTETINCIECNSHLGLLSQSSDQYRLEISVIGERPHSMPSMQKYLIVIKSSAIHNAEWHQLRTVWEYNLIIPTRHQTIWCLGHDQDLYRQLPLYNEEERVWISMWSQSSYIYVSESDQFF